MIFKSLPVTGRAWPIRRMPLTAAAGTPGVSHRMAECGLHLLDVFH